MYLLFWIAAAWLATTAVVTLAFFGARRSRLLYGWLFGDRPTAEVRRLPTPGPSVERITRLAV